MFWQSFRFVFVFIVGHAPPKALQCSSDQNHGDGQHWISDQSHGTHRPTECIFSIHLLSTSQNKNIVIIIANVWLSPPPHMHASSSRSCDQHHPRERCFGFWDSEEPNKRPPALCHTEFEKFFSRHGGLYLRLPRIERGHILLRRFSVTNSHVPQVREHGCRKAYPLHHLVQHTYSRSYPGAEEVWGRQGTV